MSAMKRLNAEYKAHGWSLAGFAADARPTWRRLLPDDKARPRLVPADAHLDLEPVEPERPTPGRPAEPQLFDLD